MESYDIIANQPVVIDNVRPDGREGRRVVGSSGVPPSHHRRRRSITAGPSAPPARTGPPGPRARPALVTLALV